MNKISYAKALTSLCTESFTINNDDLDNIVWHDNNAPNITKQQIIDEQKRLQDIEDAKPENALKASAKAKLMSGEAMTEEEANTIVI